MRTYRHQSINHVQIQRCVDLKKQINEVRREQMQKFWLLMLQHQDDSLSWLEISRNCNLDITYDKLDYLIIDSLSMNPNLSLEFIIDHDMLPWNWDRIAKTINLSDIFFMADSKPRPSSDAKHGPNLTIFNSYQLRLLENSHIVKNHSASLHIIKLHIQRCKNLTLVIDYKSLSSHPKLTMDWILSLPEDEQAKLDWSLLSANGVVKLSDVTANPNKPWSYRQLSRNPNLTIEFVVANPGRSWDWHRISYHNNITLDDVRSHPQLPWSYFGLSKNKTLTFDYVVQDLRTEADIVALVDTNLFTVPIADTHAVAGAADNHVAAEATHTATIEAVMVNANSSWNRYWISRSVNLSNLTDLSEYEDWLIDWSGISSNPTITTELILKYRDQLSWYELSCNPALDLNFVINYHDKLPWNWISLSCNKLTNSRLLKLTSDYEAAKLKLAKVFYWQCLDKMSAPPHGYYYKRDLQEMLELQAQLRCGSV